MLDPAYTSSASTSLALLRALASLCATLGLIILLAWVWRRYGQPFSHKLGLTQSSESVAPRLMILESKRLSQTTSLHLVKDGDTEHLIATTAAQTTLISTRQVQSQATKSGKVKS